MPTIKSTDVTKRHFATRTDGTTDPKILVDVVLQFKDGRVHTLAVKNGIDIGVIVFNDTRVAPSVRVFRYRNDRNVAPIVFEEVDAEWICSDDLPSSFWTVK